MKRLLTGLWTLAALMAITCAITIGLRLSSETIELIGIMIAAGIVIVLAGVFVLFGGIAREKFREIQARTNKTILESQIVSTALADYAIKNGRLIQLSDNPYLSWDNTSRPMTDDEWRTFALRHIPKNEAIALLPPAQPVEQSLDILQALDNVQCGLVVGQRESGKTTLLQWLISRRLDKSSVVILDPHSHPTRWPSGCTVIGTGRDFDSIGQALTGLQNLMNKRYREIGKGAIKEGEHKRITIIIDEWRAIVRNLGKEAGDIIAALLAESRKINIDVFVGTHSERVKALGIEGEGDLKEGFVMVRLTINKATKVRQCTIDYGDGELSATLPGPYIGLNPYSPDEDEDILELGQPAEDNKDSEFAELVNSGMSRRKASLQAYGRTYAGDIVERGQRALGEI